MSKFVVVLCALFYGSVANPLYPGYVTDLNDILKENNASKLRCQSLVDEYADIYDIKFSAKEEKVYSAWEYENVNVADYNKCIDHLRRVRDETIESSKICLRTALAKISRINHSIQKTLGDIQAAESASILQHFNDMPVERLISDIDNHLVNNESAVDSVMTQLLIDLKSLLSELERKLSEAVTESCKFIIESTA